MINPNPTCPKYSSPQKSAGPGTRIKTLAAIGLAASLLGVLNAGAASQTWTNAPADSAWNNTNNWVGRAVPGGLNMTGNSVNNDTATFNTPIPPSGIGSALNPILTDNATATNNARSRQIGSIIFDTADCGPYVFSSLSPVQNTDPNLPFTGILYVSHNGSITMNPAVTNSQTFMVPLYVRLPSSTAGIYNLVNNSTNNAATLYINGITNDSANTRGTEFVLNGSNTGTNTVAAISAGTTTSGANGLTKRGAGTWILSGPNDFRSQTVVRVLDGTLVVKDPGAFGSATTATVSESGVLQLDGVNLFQPLLNLQNGGTIRMNGTENINGVAIGTQAGTVVTLSTVNSTDTFGLGTALLATSVISGGAADSVLNLTGPGTVVLQTDNTYAGRWFFAAKTNRITSFAAFGTGPNAEVGAGAVLDFTQIGATAYVPTTSGFGGSGSGTAVGSTAAAVLLDPAATLDLSGKAVNLTFTPASASGDTTHPSLYIAQGTLALSGNTFFVNNASGTPLGAGTYRLIQQASGSVTSGGGYAVLVDGAGLANGTAAQIQVSGGNVDMIVSIYTPKDLVWKGGNPDSVWGVNGSANFLDGATPSVFNNSDAVTFDATGSANPTVNLSGTLAPVTVTVDTSANDYTFTGSGQIGGPGSLEKISNGTLDLQTVNTYAGGTAIKGGVLRYGIADAISSTGDGDVSVEGTGVIDLNNFNGTINGLNGDGTIDNTAGGASVLTVGSNDRDGIFDGTLQNTAGTLGLTKVGSGTQTLTDANSYNGPTTINAGTLIAANNRALGSNDLVLNGGTLDVKTPLLKVNTLAGTGGTIANNSQATTNRLVVQGTADTTFGGAIVDGTGGGGMGLTLLGGTLTMSGASTYTGGTFVGSGATFAIPNSPASVGGFIIASNNAILALSGGSGTPGTPNSVTTVDGATVTFTSGAEGKIWQAQFFGGVNTTNRFIGPISAGQSLSFSNFLGTVVFANTNEANLNFRFFNGGGISGGENTTFVFEHVNVHTRDSQTVRLGEIVGGNTTAGIGDQTGIVSWEIGAKNTTTAFHGYIGGLNNSIVKVGTGGLTLDGRNYFTNQVTLPDSSVVSYPVFTNAISYRGSTTVSNGTLAIVAPNNLSNSASIVMAGGTLDASQMGYFTNQTTLDINGIEQATNSVVVVKGGLDLASGQTVGGFGTIVGKLTGVNNTINPGLPVGTLTITEGIALDSSVVNVGLDRSASSTSGQLAAAGATSIVINGGTLNITNAGPDLVTGDVFHVFNKGLTGSGFTTINLPTANANNTVQYTWQTNLTTDGTLVVLQGASPVATNPTNITFSVSGGTLSLSWPADHLGWRLQSQTNALNVGLTSNWFDVEGSTSVTQMDLTISATNEAVFYRLMYPLP